MINMKQVSKLRTELADIIKATNNVINKWRTAVNKSGAVTMDAVISRVKSEITSGKYELSELEQVFSLSTEEMVAFVMQCKLFGLPELDVDVKKSYIDSQGIWLQFKP